jgi:plasmid stabilization system protein ParE
MRSRRQKALRWLEAASDDLARIVEEIARNNPRAADRFVDQIRARVEFLVDFPYLCAVCPSYRKARQLIHGNYVIYYTVHRDRGPCRRPRGTPLPLVLAAPQAMSATVCSSHPRLRRPKLRQERLGGWRKPYHGSMGIAPGSAPYTCVETGTGRVACRWSTSRLVNHRDPGGHPRSAACSAISVPSPASSSC